MEFPALNPAAAGRRARYVYTAAFTGAAAFFDALQKVDLHSGAVHTRVFSDGRAPSEVTFVPRGGGGGAAEDDGYLLCLAYDPARHGTDVLVLDARDIEAPPVCTLRLEHHVPYTFHGAWQPLPPRA